ncbi:hypothetical protein [Streptomyces sp. T028]|uniref:hypothetical protein n=1 Tax=Streptomyces sp. T028 TaxID=3394379 RepID=UPI003A89BE0F
MTDDRHKDDLERVKQQNDVTDFARKIEDGHGQGLLSRMVRSAVEATPVGRAVQQRTNFEGHSLNEMIDLVENTNPEDLASSGRALWDAREAILAAAQELDGHITKVEWVGESGDAFRTWGRSLVTSTEGLGTFAGAAADQITAAATGLASVRTAMPHRDARTNPMSVADIPKAERIQTNDDYTAAVKVEKDRQEAINQMNRLSSYYAVSEEVLSSLQAPEFKAMPDVGVPQPTRTSGDLGQSGAGTSGDTATSLAGRHLAEPSVGRVGVSGATGATTPAQDLTHRVSYPDQPVSTVIDSVTTPPAPTSPPSTGPGPSSAGATGTGSGPNSGFPTGYAPPMVSGTSGRGPAGGGVRIPVSAQGRTGAPTMGTPASGRAVGQGSMGRPTATGQSLGRGNTLGTPPSSTARGITGGTPRVGGPAAPRAGGGGITGAGQSHGVVGGRSTTSASGSTTATTGSRIPRGTVIGGEGTANTTRPVTGQINQRGVVGAPGPMPRAGSEAVAPRGAVGPIGPVTGSPAARNSVVHAERNGMTRGGAGLVRGVGGGQGVPAGRDSTQGGASRPGYSVEDEETHLSDRPRRDVPPVIN